MFDKILVHYFKLVSFVNEVQVQFKQYKQY